MTAVGIALIMVALAVFAVAPAADLLTDSRASKQIGLSMVGAFVALIAGAVMAL